MNTTMKKGISVRWKLILYMTVFVIVVLIVTWFFQIFMLGQFYRSVKKDEMIESADRLSEKLGTDELNQAAYNAAIDDALCVTVYKIETGYADRQVSIDATGGESLGTLSQEKLDQFYRKALENGGSFHSRIAFGNLEIPNQDLLDRLPFPDNEQNAAIPLKNMRMIYVRIVEVGASDVYMLLLDTSLQPLDSTVRTLSLQYVWIAAIILAAAVVMVFILYRKISAPLVRMNNSAKLLARGKYDVEFSGKGYRETRELAETLNYASHELSRVDRLQKELIANISHDLRTPLTMIRGYGEIMRDLPDENTPENMQVIIDETTRLSDLVNDLLDLSRIQAGAVDPAPTLFDLTQTVREVLQRYDTLIKHRGYRLEFAPGEDVYVYADRGMILQVLYNLINNAINYTGEDHLVMLEQVKHGQSVQIRVTDTGTGIAPEEIPLIWDRYYKVDKVHKRAMVGTGLGLSIVKEILQLHHATYGVDSTLGAGSTFWFELPLAELPPTQITQQKGNEDL